MLIKEAFAKLANSTHPVAQSLHSGAHFKTLILAFKSGMILKDHKANIKSKLTVLEGTVSYQESNRKVELSQYDTIDIPVGLLHRVVAQTDALCLLTQGE